MVKRSILRTLAVVMSLLLLAGCQKTVDPDPSIVSEHPSRDEDGEPMESPAYTEKSVLVVYFSCSGNTEQIAEWAAVYANADLYQITPETPYTSADLSRFN